MSQPDRAILPPMADNPRVFVCGSCAYVFTVQADYCPVCDSVEVTVLDPPAPPIARPERSERPRGRLVGFSPIPGDPVDSAP